jgi:ATP-binding cassette subfamily B protein
VLGLVTGSADVVQWMLRTLTTVGRYQYLVDVSGRSRPRPDRRVTVTGPLTDGIRLENVTHRYAHGGEALRDVNLFLPAGSTVAVVGANGAGKTTLVKLLAGLHVPSAGRVTVDDVDLRDVDLDRWRRHVAATFQDHARFEFRVREVLGMGDLDAGDDAAMLRALHRAGAADLVDTLPSGLETQLGPRWPGGVDLSGGQWQKLALGRAMMRPNPLLLLLDEPTAALDADIEHRLFQRWTEAARDARRRSGAITVLISHRFSTVRMADLIVVMDHGRVAELGGHAELMDRGGLYAELFTLQAAAYR